MSKIICSDTGEPYSTEGRCAVEILFLIEERMLTEEEFRWYIEVQTKINAVAERVSKMSDEQILKLGY